MISLIKNRVAVTPIFDPTHAGAEYADPRLGAPVDLWIPDDARERCDQGIVKYIGPDVKHLKIGDYVIFSGYTGTLVRVDDEQLIIFPEEFAVAILPQVPATEVPGLYFKGVRASSEILDKMEKAFHEWASRYEVVISTPLYNEAIHELLLKLSSIVSAGEPYFPATYEQAMALITRAVQDAPWHKLMNVNAEKPTPEDYERLKAGVGS